jgi:hypothetical protein
MKSNTSIALIVIFMIACVFGASYLFLLALQNNDEAINLVKDSIKYKHGATYTITVLEGFDETIFTFPEDQCGIELKIKNWTTPEDCIEGEDCKDVTSILSNDRDMAIITDKKGNSYMSIPAEGGYWDCTYHEEKQ